jgi:endonuclease/exonuclease/phosphatase family metal-dependent hydrolase
MEGERFTCLVQHIREQQYDVIAFQELIKRHFYDRKHLARYESFVGELRSLGYVHDIRGPKNESTMRPLDGGTAIFSKHPFARCSEHHWQQQASWDAWASKGILHALIDIMPPADAMSLPPMRMHIFTLHAQASHHGWQNTAGASKYRKVRVRQMQQLAEVIRTEAADGEPVLVMGDFNFDAKQVSELHFHQAELSHGTGRSGLPVDVVAATFGGDHPATYAWRTEEGKLAEPFLTTNENAGFPQSIDHVYFWPKEAGGLCRHAGTSDWQDSCITSISAPRCNLEPCPYNGPANQDGTRPSHVSDHCGWSVSSKLTWSFPADVEHLDIAPHGQQSALVGPTDWWTEITNSSSLLREEKACQKISDEKRVVRFMSNVSKAATYWMLGWLLFFCTGRYSFLHKQFGR